MEPTRIVLIRHAQSEANARLVCEGQGDSPLTAQGRSEATALARSVHSLFPRAIALYSSPLRRARQTANPIALHTGLQVEVADDLREGDVGSWEGLSHSAIDWDPMRKDPDLALHGGESPRALATRVARTLHNLAEQHAGGAVLVVSHGAAITHALAAILGTEPLFGDSYALENGRIAELTIERRTLRLL